MIIGIIHKGSGLGDQLFSYIATRVRAADLGVDFGFVGKEFFKGASFMDLNWGNQTQQIEYSLNEVTGEVRPLMTKDPYNGIYKLDKPYYDPEFNFIKDWTYIDGYGAQDIRYFEHRLGEVREWLKVSRPPESDNWFKKLDSICIINFRGGEYKAVPELFLGLDYWVAAIVEIKSKYPHILFQVHTDDPIKAREFFPDYEIIQDIELNWKSIRYAKHLIVSNSAFAILPALLNENVKEVIAPKFWAGRNVGEWRRPGNYYKKFTYI